MHFYLREHVVVAGLEQSYLVLNVSLERCSVGWWMVSRDHGWALLALALLDIRIRVLELYICELR